MLTRRAVLRHAGASALATGVLSNGVSCHRENGRWLERGGANGAGWEQTGHDPDVGTLSFWDDAPVDADMVRVEFDGRIVEEPVIDHAFLVVWWGVSPPQDWPRARAFRIEGRWIDSAGVRAG